MRLQLIAVFCSLICSEKLASGQTAILSQVAAELDSWTSRDTARVAVLKITSHPVPLLADFAESKNEPDIRRSRSISLLATFKLPESQRALVQLADDPTPKFRCLALQSLTELDSQVALPVLVRKLDDKAVCMKLTITDSARGRDVYVSDEAVRLLEMTTGKTFNKDPKAVHRATNPWKEWWAKRVSGPN